MKKFYASSIGILAATVLVLNGLGTTSVRARVLPPPRGQDAINIAALRQVGLSGDNSQIPMLISALRDAPHPAYRYASIHALAQLGAAQALPDFAPLIQRSILQTSIDPDLSNFTQVEKARLLAESDAKHISISDARAQAKMREFLTSLNINADQLNKAPARKQRDAPTPTTVYALRELADMIYQHRDASLASCAESQGVQFGFRQELPFTSLKASVEAQNHGSLDSIDTPAALKFGLAPLSDHDRIHWLIQKLSHSWVTDDDTCYAIQLAIDEGVDASNAAAEKLTEMRADPGQYSGPGFNALFMIIRGVGDVRQMPQIEQFLNDSDARIAHDAEIAYHRIQSGTPETLRVGY